MKITFDRLSLPKSGALAVLIEEGESLSGPAAELDRLTNGHLKRAMKAAQFTGKKEQVLQIVSPNENLSHVLLLGTGKAATLTAREIELLGGAALGMLQATKAKSAAISVTWNDKNKITPAEAASLIASGAKLRCYGFDLYKSKKKDEANKLDTLSIQSLDADGARRRFSSLSAVAEGNHFARNLVNEPANVLNPIEFAKRTLALKKYGVKIEVLDTAQMRKLGMGALLGVAQGSVNEPRIVIMRWDGGKKDDKPLAFIGKGVTFDSGGLSIKPAASMEEMKGDMAGAASVTGLMLALAKRKAKANVIGAIGLVENAVDGKAQRPGDVVKSMSGQTIAVLNTDAEGRLVLADLLWHVQNKFKPKFMVDLATLTGAIMVALGKEHAGLFSNNDELAARIAEAGLATGEKVWRMPLAPEYDKLLDHDVADMKNIGGRFGGAITGAQFIQRFVNNVPWAHLDIAGTAIDSPKSAISQSWANGWGVRLLNELVSRHYEK